MFEANRNEIAAVILEPIVGNAGFIRPKDRFLSELREICTKEGTLLIFDEVMTGFRVHLTGAQGLFKISPDLVTLGKVVGGGMPLAVYGGRKDIMQWIAPSGPVYQAGTLSGNPIAVASGLKTLEVLSRPGNFSTITERTKQLVSGMIEISKKHKVPFQADFEGGMFGFFFIDKPVYDFAGAKGSNVERFKTFFHAMLDEGIYLAPSAFEAGFVSLAHTEADINSTIAAFDRVLGRIL
jgi:glutamate-1-semialdehyde 2,1-aminomutase